MAKHERGLMVPPLTPFTEDLKVDREALRRCVDYVVTECSAQFVVAAGVEAQEYHYLSMEERRDLIAMTIDFVDGRVPVAVGISHPSFRTAIDLAQFAQDCGASAIQLLAPLRSFGGPPTDDDLIRYFEAVVAETDAPLVAYLNPGPGADVSVAGTIALAKIDRVKYMKESSRDLARVGRLIKEIDLAGHARYYTTMQMLLPSLQLGGSGATMPPPGAELANRIVKAFQAGQLEEAARLQLQFAEFPHRWMHRGLTAVMKASMSLLGRDMGGLYPPYQDLSEAEIRDLAAYLKTTDLTLAEEMADDDH